MAVGEILVNYDHDKKIPMYGFGTYILLIKIQIFNFLYFSYIYIYRS